MQKLTVNVQRNEKFYISASVYARAIQNYRSRMSLERYGPRIGTSMSVEDVVRTVAKFNLRVQNKYSNTSIAAVHEWMVLASEDNIHTSVEGISALVDITIVEIYANQDHCREVEERLKNHRP